MGIKTARRPGRPRASGNPPAVFTINVTQAESVPFVAGVRIYEAYRFFDETQFETLETVSPYLSQNERRSIAPMGESLFRMAISGSRCPSAVSKSSPPSRS